ncbi:MAG: AsnC family transcriptional regulator [Desulfotignum sp.]|nr:AsnC family transcriptional regulator [Desulfotignum sp.]MCF8136799.1 AsnC family transcriptional regulator [Desulfotignum sp.]
MTAINETDKAILNLIQVDFPIDARPFRVLAEKLDLTEEELIARIQALKDLQVIRRIGGNFSPDRLGYYSTLCAATVPKERIDLFTRTVNTYAGVTHNYMRDHAFNIWFTFIAPSRDQIAESLEEISRQTGVSPILNLPATRLFKISANFKL